MILRITHLILLVVLSPAFIYCQSRGGIIVEVKDADGAVIPASEVVFAKVHHKTKVNHAGLIKLENIEPGQYLVFAEAPGFLPSTPMTITIEPGVERKISFSLNHDLELKETHFSSLTEAQVEWHSNHLAAMNEEPLCKPVRPGEAERYRFLWLRTFDQPILVSVTIESGDRATLNLKVLSGKGGYEPGKLRKNESWRLKKPEVEHLRLVHKEADFWKMPTRIETNTVGLDGAQWITEGTKDGTCHVVDRWSPEPGIYKGLGIEFLIQLAKLKLLYQEVY